MPKVRTGVVNVKKQAAQVVAATDVAAIVAAAQAAQSVPELRRAVSDLAQLVKALAKAVGLQGMNLS